MNGDRFKVAFDKVIVPYIQSLHDWRNLLFMQDDPTAGPRVHIADDVLNYVHGVTGEGFTPNRIRQHDLAAVNENEVNDLSELTYVVHLCVI